MICSMRWKRAHPRSRGEHTNRCPLSPGSFGSSPLTRGARNRDVAICSHFGLIPAHAGSTRRHAYPTPPPAAHPRSRGEHASLKTRLRIRCGSSPLTRGAPASTHQSVVAAGLIPAHAGSTCGLVPQIPACGAHPRSRGEHLRGCFCQLGDRGSSPLTRGAPTRKPWTKWAERLIPAHAGST